MQDEKKIAGEMVESAAKGITKGALETIPVYQDAFQPAAKELGKALETAIGTVNAVLAPLRGLIWSFKTAEAYISEAVGRKLNELPPDQIITPSPIVAVPTIQALMLTAGEPTLSDMYANLLATAMDKATSGDAHPSFVELIKQMNSDEAKIFIKLGESRSIPCLQVKAAQKALNVTQDLLRNFTDIGDQVGCSYPNRTPAYIDNLRRLGLLEIENRPLNNHSLYEPLREHPQVQTLMIKVDERNYLEFKTKEACITITALGIDFYNACIASKGKTGQERISMVPPEIMPKSDGYRWG